MLDGLMVNKSAAGSKWAIF